jgi:hypothetical protein
VTRRTRLALIAAASVLAAWLVWGVARRGYLEPRQTRLEKILLLRGDVAAANKALDDAPRVNAALDELAARTLGGDLETVDHRLRSHLNRIGEEIGLRDLSVGTGRSRNLETPAPGEFNKTLREELDGVEIEGWLSGRGTLEQVLRAVDRLETESWLKRIGQVRLQAAENGAAFEVTVRLSTIFLPGRGPAATPADEPAWAYDPASFESHSALLASNPFALPAPGAAAPPVAAEGFPYGTWMVTGVARGPSGPEVWLRSAAGETRRLSIGEALGDLVLAAADGETAEFTRAGGGEPVRASVGETLPAAAR